MQKEWSSDSGGKLTLKLRDQLESSELSGLRGYQDAAHQPQSCPAGEGVEAIFSTFNGTSV